MTRDFFFKQTMVSALCLAAWVSSADGADETDQTRKIQIARETFEVSGHKAFVIEPPKLSSMKGRMPWVWYAPTFATKLPSAAEEWMFERFNVAGIAIAGIDVGESYGSPNGRAIFQALYEELTTERGFDKKPVLLARSRGGLMLYNWAAEHPDCVRGIAGIYPVGSLVSYPGLEKAAPAYGMTVLELQASLTQHNPIDRLQPLANADVPIMHIHGDHDELVPLESNSAELALRYKKLGGQMELILAENQGHTMWKGFFNNQQLVDFVIAKFE